MSQRIAGLASAGFWSVASALASVAQSSGRVTDDLPTSVAHLPVIGIDPVTFTLTIPGLLPGVKWPSPLGSPSADDAALLALGAKSLAPSSFSDGSLRVIQP